ncbi:MAG: hypothetical protein MRY21_03665 [Simkaniaceae bacterium]|nr:hypothetical protein [Simkaniaceae bacterium]
MACELSFDSYDRFQVSTLSMDRLESLKNLPVEGGVKVQNKCTKIVLGILKYLSYVVTLGLAHFAFKKKRVESTFSVCKKFTEEFLRNDSSENHVRILDRVVQLKGDNSFQCEKISFLIKHMLNSLRMGTKALVQNIAVFIQDSNPQSKVRTVVEKLLLKFPKILIEKEVSTDSLKEANEKASFWHPIFAAGTKPKNYDVPDADVIIATVQAEITRRGS